MCIALACLTSSTAYEIIQAPQAVLLFFFSPSDFHALTDMICFRDCRFREYGRVELLVTNTERLTLSRSHAGIYFYWEGTTHYVLLRLSPEIVTTRL